jgi:hypothetical protein
MWSLKPTSLRLRLRYESLKGAVQPPNQRNNCPWGQNLQVQAKKSWLLSSLTTAYDARSVSDKEIFVFLVFDWRLLSGNDGCASHVLQLVFLKLGWKNVVASKKVLVDTTIDHPTKNMW